MKEVIETQNATIASQGGDLDKLRALQERMLKEKVKKDHKIAALQKKLARREQEIEVLKKTQDTCESDYYNLEDRMKLLRKRNSFLEVNLDKANKTSDAAKKTVEMKEEECRLMASIIHDTRRATVSNTTTYAPQFSAPAYDNHDTGGGRGARGAASAREARSQSSPAKPSLPASPPVEVESLLRRISLAGSRNGGTTIEDELKELVVSPDSLDGDSLGEEDEE